MSSLINSASPCSLCSRPRSRRGKLSRAVSRSRQSGGGDRQELQTVAAGGIREVQMGVWSGRGCPGWNWGAAGGVQREWVSGRPAGGPALVGQLGEGHRSTHPWPWHCLSLYVTVPEWEGDCSSAPRWYCHDSIWGLRGKERINALRCPEAPTPQSRASLLPADYTLI